MMSFFSMFATGIPPCETPLLRCIAPTAVVPPTNLDELFPMMSSHRRLLNGGPKFASDIVLLGRLHLTTSVIPAVEMLMAAGMRPPNIILVGKAYAYAHGDFVRGALRARGVRVVSDEELSEALFDEIAARIDRERLRLLTIEDGAEIVSRVHARSSLKEAWIGGAEQTTFGLWRLDAFNIQQPVVALPTSKVKADFEAPHIAASGLHAVKNFFPNVCVADWRVAVLGLGAIGRHVLIAADELGCDVVGYDEDPVVRLRCRHLRAKAIKTSAIDCVRGADLIIGTTGRLAIDADILAASNPHSRIASMSSERVEADVPYLRCSSLRTEPLLRYAAGMPENRTIGTRYLMPNQRTVDLLADGYPINFSDLGVLCERHTDFVVGWVVLCGLEVARGTFSGQKGVLRDAADEVLKKHDLARQYERFWA